jgi:DNA-binding NarL/FixJ family response regulator
LIGSASPAVAFDLNDDSAGGFTQLGLVRILIVDDFEPWRSAVCSILARDEDLEVVGESSDGLDAVQKIEELHPDLVLLDIQLPKMNGLDAARQIRKISPDTKILFLSSYCGLEVMQEALKVGVGFVVKADASRDLLPIIKAIIRNEPFVRFRFLFDTPSNPSEM